ncbi:D-xylose transporter XylE [Flavobacteriaceae bacterium]|nr:D-xylose transporter XylE [Flavobacteriaceae bacterium]
MTNTRNGYLIKLTLVATLGGLLFGYDTGVISGTVDSLENFFITDQNMTEFDRNAFKGFLISAALIGCVIGGALGGYIGKVLGRKKALVLAGILFFISAIGSAIPELNFITIFCNNCDANLSNVFVIYRIIGGIGVGLASMMAPVYIAEIAPAKDRGKLVSYNQLAIVGGFLVVYLVNYFIALNGDDSWLNELGWRYMFGSELIPVSIFLILLFLVPDTPRSLVFHNKEDEALDVLTKVNGKTEAVKILNDIKNTLKEKTVPILTYGYGIIIIGILLSVFQQFVGINVVLYYAVDILKDLNLGTQTALLWTILIGVMNFAFTIIAIRKVDSYGRKPLMIIGAIGMSISMFSLGFAFYSEVSGYVALFCMMIYVASFALSWGPVTWVLLSEIFPNNIRNKALAIAVAAQWASNYLVSATFPLMKDSTYLKETFNNGFAYWIYGLMSLLAVYFVFKFIPETKGKKLEEMESLWEK